MFSHKPDDDGIDALKKEMGMLCGEDVGSKVVKVLFEKKKQNIGLGYDLGFGGNYNDHFIHAVTTLPQRSIPKLLNKLWSSAIINHIFLEALIMKKLH